MHGFDILISLYTPGNFVPDLLHVLQNLFHAINSNRLFGHHLRGDLFDQLPFGSGGDGNLPDVQGLIDFL